MNTQPNSTLNRFAALILAAFVVCPVLGRAEAVDLDFSNPMGSSNGSDFLGDYWNSSVLKFQNVATVGALSVDMRVTATAYGTYSFTHQYADYSQASLQPDGDLGALFTSTGNGSGGLHYQLEFFEHGSNFTTAYAISELKLLVYDVDGESAQSEKLRVYNSDGLYAYQTGTVAASVTASRFASGVLFTGPGQNFSETDPTGALILTYRNTSSILLDFESQTFSGGSGNGVFSAIDGDLSMLGGDESGYTAPTNVPEPSGALLLGVAGLLILVRRRRR